MTRTSGSTAVGSLPPRRIFSQTHTHATTSATPTDTHHRAQSQPVESAALVIHARILVSSTTGPTPIATAATTIVGATRRRTRITTRMSEGSRLALMGVRDQCLECHGAYRDRTGDLRLAKAA